MPLTRANVTAASRIMLPTYPVFFASIAAGLLFTPLDRLVATPAWRFADQLVSLRLWGVGFGAVALGMAIAMLTHHRHRYKVALGVAVVWMTLWAGILASAFLFGDTSPFAWTWPAFVARACYASLVSLETRET